MLKVATWNVNSIGIRLERLLSFLERVAPDVVCLQELKCQEEKFPFEAIRAAGYFATVYGQKTYNGVAVLSKKEPEAVSRGFGDGVADEQARFVAARIDGTTVMSAYVPNGQAVGSDKYFYKLNWLARLRRYLDREYSASDSLVLAGDFNVAPADADVHDASVWRDSVLCSPRERQALFQVESFGFTDAWRHLYPDETAFTWWDYRMLAFQKNQGMRIDLIYVTAPLAAALTECRVEREERKGEKPSDHAPVLAAWR